MEFDEIFLQPFHFCGADQCATFPIKYIILCAKKTRQNRNKHRFGNTFNFSARLMWVHLKLYCVWLLNCSVKLVNCFVCIGFDLFFAIVKMLPILRLSITIKLTLHWLVKVNGVFVTFYLRFIHQQPQKSRLLFSTDHKYLRCGNMITITLVTLKPTNKRPTSACDCVRSSANIETHVKSVIS